MASLAGKLSLGQALFRVVAPAVTFVGSIFLARYVNMVFDRIHEQNQQEGQPGAGFRTG